MTRSPFWIAALIALTFSSGRIIQAAEAPWGFTWSQAQDSLPRPSSIVTEANQTSLVYEGAALPVQMKDAEVVILRVCSGRGLQQVRWISRTSSQAAAIDKFLNAYEQGVRRYGKSNEGDVDRGTVGWSRERIGIRLQRDDPAKDAFRIIMISDGPEFDECQAEYKRTMGQ